MAVLKKYGALLFALILLSHCLFIYLEMNELRVLTKLLLLPFLIIYLFALSTSKPNMLAVCGLLFSFAGDVLLTRSGEIFFLLGMAAFIGTHICNSIVFVKYQNEQEADGKIVIAAIAIVAILSAVVYKTLEQYLGNFKWPILIYMGIISIMAVLGTRMVNNPLVRSAAFRYFIPGVGLFVLSDAILALNKFRFHEGALDIAVMLTYGAAQFCLVRGFAAVSLVKIELKEQ